MTENSLTDKMIDYSDKRQHAHIKAVCKNIDLVCTFYPKHKGELALRKIWHDQSKFKEPEYTPYLYINWMYKCKRDGIPYEYPEGILERTQEATIHHVLNNRHHPEFHAGEAPINMTNRDKSDKPIDASGMNTVDIIEMVCDWQAVAEERGANTARDWFNHCSGTRWMFTKDQLGFIDKIIALWEKIR
jgi:hypothetical protein